MNTLMIIGFAFAICGFAEGLVLICLDHDWGIAVIAAGAALGFALLGVGGAL